MIEQRHKLDKYINIDEKVLVTLLPLCPQGTN